MQKDLMEDLPFPKECTIKRKQMETQSAAGGGGGGGEVRKVHIIYFLSRKGRIEHPHLIRVHHLSRNGVRLRDVKRWLSELRGKDMPESFSWSYKRRYKAGYVWQDLLDEDLITPISDIEYVLKGSEISSPSFITGVVGSYGEKEEVLKQDKSPSSQVETKDPMDNMSRKTSFEIEELPLFGSETSTEDTTKHQDEKFEGGGEHEEEVQSQKDKTENNSFYEAFWNKNKNNSKSKKGGDNKKVVMTSSEASPSSNYSFGKSSSYSGSGASHMFRNWITCGAVDTNESAVMVINRRRTSLMNVFSESNSKEETDGLICKGEKLGGSERISGNSLAQSEQQQSGRKSYDGKKGSKKSKNSEFNNSKTFPAAYKPVNGPNCSQCGKQFKPEKLHSHMTSCRGMKAFTKSGVPSVTTTTGCKPKRSTPDSSSQDSNSFSACYLTR